MYWISAAILAFLCLLLVSCGVTVPVPIPGFMVPADKTTLHSPSCFRFKGRLHVLGGYFEKAVPDHYVTRGIMNEPGMRYDDKQILNKQVYEITDEEEAFIIESYIKRSKSGVFAVNPESWKNIGKISSREVIRDNEYYLEYKGSMYAIGGTGHKVESCTIGKTKYDSCWLDVEHADVWTSSDLRNWKRICDKVPWSMEKYCRKNHKISATDDAIYITGGEGMSLDGKEKSVQYGDVWRSEDGRTWREENGKFPYQYENRVEKLNGKFFHIEDQSTLYVSDDGINWRQMLFSEHMLGFLDGKIVLIVSNGYRKWSNRENDLYFSMDGLRWRHGKTGKTLSLIPHDMGEWTIYRSRYSKFNLVEFNDSMWLVGAGPDRLYRTSDGNTWKKMEVRNDKRFLPRTDAAVGVYGGYIWIMGGEWRKRIMDGNRAVSNTFSVALSDIWRSRDGLNWELVTDNAPWGTFGSGTLIAARGRLFLAKRGVRWDRLKGVLGAPVEVWSTTDGVRWERESGKSGDVVIAADNQGRIDRVVETGKSLYFLDGPRYEVFLDKNKETVKGIFTLDNFRWGKLAGVEIDGRGIVALAIKARRFCISGNLVQWDCCYEPDADRKAESVFTTFLHSHNYGPDVQYELFIFKDRLHMAGADFYSRKIHSGRLYIDVANKTVRLTAPSVD